MLFIESFSFQRSGLANMKNTARIVFVANNGSFFFRHFTPAVNAARAVEAAVCVMLPLTRQLESRHAGIEIIDSPIEREQQSILGILTQVTWLIQRFHVLELDIAVAYSLRACLVLAIALPFIRARKVVFYITGLGLTDLLTDIPSRLRRAVIYFILRTAGRSPRCHFIFENSNDPQRLGTALATTKAKSFFMGAGVDPVGFSPAPLSFSGMLRIAIVSRLIWSKGVDLAVEAVSKLVEQGYAVELNIFGSPDNANPRAMKDDQLVNSRGITYRGNTDDIQGVWAQNHVALFPSRGGEGLPRALLEAASCGKACIVADVPGCRDFVRNGIEGLVVPANSVEGIPPGTETG
jgi:glycosyltransferase involved in cell wall biosynthesis